MLRNNAYLDEYFKLTLVSEPPSRIVMTVNGEDSSSSHWCSFFSIKYEMYLLLLLLLKPGDVQGGGEKAKFRPSNDDTYTPRIHVNCRLESAYYIRVLHELYVCVALYIEKEIDGEHHGRIINENLRVSIQPQVLCQSAAFIIIILGIFPQLRLCMTYMFVNALLLHCCCCCCCMAVLCCFVVIVVVVVERRHISHIRITCWPIGSGRIIIESSRVLPLSSSSQLWRS